MENLLSFTIYRVPFFLEDFVCDVERCECVRIGSVETLLSMSLPSLLYYVCVYNNVIHEMLSPPPSTMSLSLSKSLMSS